MDRGRWSQLPNLVLILTAMGGVVVALWAAPQVHGQATGGDEKEIPTTQPALPPDVDPLLAREQLVSGLVGSKHDFRNLNEYVRDLCLPCHTPHLAVAQAPLLDQRQPTTQPMRPYQSLEVELTGWSLLCLGCHDGVTATDVYTSAHAVQVSDQLAGSRLGTTGLRSHPLGIRYPRPDENYEPAAAVEAAGLPLPDGRIQCSTCHDAHNTHRYEGMLRIPNQRSRLCLTCHRR